MLPVNLTASQMPSYHAALKPDLTMFPTVDVLNLSQQYIRTIGPDAISEAQVDVVDPQDYSVRRTFAMTFDDADPMLGFNTETPWAGLGVLFQVWLHVWVPDLGVWAAVPMGRFRPNAPTDNGGATFNHIEAQDKACLHLRNARPGVITKGTNWVEAIRKGLQDAGETLFNFPPPGALTGVVTADIPIGGQDEANQPWRVWCRLADDKGYDLQHDGLGRATLRSQSDATVAAEWAEDSLTGIPSASVDLTTLRNAVYAVDKSGKHDAEFVISSEQPGSMQSLAFGGVPWESWDFVNPDIEAKNLDAWAASQLAQDSQQVETVTAAGLPMPHLEPSDWCSATVRGITRRFPFESGSIPLTPGAMSIGYNTRTATLTGVRASLIPPAKSGKGKKRRRRRRR